MFVVPFWLAIGTIVQNSGQIVGWAESVASLGLPPPPSWLGDLPLVGARAARAWQDIADIGVRELLQKARPYAGTMTQWFISAVGGFGMVLVQFLLTVAVSAIMYAKGERAAARVIRFGVRLAGERGEQSVRLAAQAIRGVALGVVVTALIQSAIGGFGLVIAGVPFASVLCALMFMLCIAQIGPALVLLPAVIWMFASDDPGWAIFLLVCSILAIGIDNVIRPILIRKGRRPAAAAHPGRRDRRADGLRIDRHLPRPHGPCRRLHAPGGMDRRGRHERNAMRASASPGSATAAGAASPPDRTTAAAFGVSQVIYSQ